MDWNMGTNVSESLFLAFSTLKMEAAGSSETLVLIY
jgi:hypothetical protein